jgi:hypothetical protein
MMEFERMWAVDNVYRCRQVQYDQLNWESIDPVSLVDVVTGERVKEATLVKACWDTDALYIRFECEDAYTVSRFTQRDEPLYEQDVVEVFLDEDGKGTRDFEIEISPNNIVFDAVIENDQGKLTVGTDWDAEGLKTNVWTGDGLRIYELELSFFNFARKPQKGTEWRVNFYRIDEERDGTRHFQAWSPTGAVNYHIPSRFGRLLFAIEV